MQLVYHNKTKTFIAICSYEERQIPKDAGFTWTKLIEKKWATTDVTKALKLAKYANEECRKELEYRLQEKQQTIKASLATDSDVIIPIPKNLEYMPFQKAGIAFMKDKRAVLLADQMGLGKTIQTIGLINLLLLEDILIISPASLKLNWEKELKKWLVKNLTIQILSPQDSPRKTNITIINYDILKNFQELYNKEWQLVVVDEAQAIKNPKSQRSQLVKAIKAKRRILLTGTPIVNRPAELFPLINYLDPITWPNFFPYAIRYAGAYRGRWGWDFSGATNLGELQERLRSTIMLRRLKEHVLKDLPPKRRQVIELPTNGIDIVENEKKAWGAQEDRLANLKMAVEIAKASDDPEEYKDAIKKLKDGTVEAFTKISRLRHLTAIAKIPYVKDHIQEILENDIKIVVFAHHHDVINTLHKEFPDISVILTGETKLEDRQKAIEAFQTQDNIKIFIGSITAAGVGITLTASSHIIFAELDWVPGNMNQCEDRIHRIGQSESVLIQHLVLEGSLDAHIAKTLMEKQEIIEKTLDEELPSEVIVPEKEQDTPATKTITQKQIEEESFLITPTQITAIHEALRYLAGFDWDKAQDKNDVGFNKIDTMIGHRLAMWSKLTPKQAILGKRILMKYHRQLPEELLQIINVGNL